MSAIIILSTSLLVYLRTNGSGMTHIFLCSCKVSFNNFDIPEIERAFREILLHDQVSNKFLAHGRKPPQRIIVLNDFLITISLS